MRDRSSWRRCWVEEKTGGQTSASNVLTIDLAALRTDRESVVATLMQAASAQPIVVDIVDESDMRQLVLALHEARDAGRRFLHRVGPPFVRALIGQDPRQPLRATELNALNGETHTATRGGLVVVGSHVSATTRQLDALRERHAPVELEIDIDQVRDGRREDHLSELARTTRAALSHGNVVIRTARTLVTGSDARDSLAIARTVSAAVVELVRRVVESVTPRFVVAKGGITSSDVAAHGLGIERAFVRGPMLPGIVSLWEPMGGPVKGVPYVVFAGNVGGPEALADVVETLSR
ncbi:four-carbon acid sugar kinase family protein [Saccharopolyspora mangrovi]|uniref:Nucleotide-binding domain containing protein n=1 Tax=Saccharopolyspora mangrovi TaxID=3082379 RepID=A0ABU6AK33_9PSEU|nr:nucleotide-binding domain containing protein [Saccharopolyspora sp. S2-29]MEB3371791.1 nucleotide-binding domain containing protein [Saccharopolyspora sp. S2-29]